MATDGVQARATIDAVLEQVEAALQRAEEAAGAAAQGAPADPGPPSNEALRGPADADAAHEGLGTAAHRHEADAVATPADSPAFEADALTPVQAPADAAPMGDPDLVMRGLMHLLADLLGPPDARGPLRPEALAGLMQNLAQGGAEDAPVGPAWFFEPTAWSDVLSGADGHGPATDPTGATDA